jgi:hypothetical protein
MTLQWKSSYIRRAVDQDENPLERASRTAKKNGFQTPIDEIDAAARILDPVFSGVNEGTRLYGKFLKDYKETEW